MSPEEKSPIERAEELIRELEIYEPSKAEKYEECETIARLAPQEVVDLIDDPRVKEDVNWIKKAHEGTPSLIQWRKAFAHAISSLLEGVGGIDRIKKWHELEAICDKISEEELKNVNKDLREAIAQVQHIHDNSSERREKIIKKINSQAGRF